jgi:membrane dipeptidase
MYHAIDLHCDSVEFLVKGYDLRKPNADGQVDLPRLQAGGIGVQVFAAWVPPATPPEKAFAFASGLLDKIDSFAVSDPLLVSVENAEDCRRAIAQGKTGILRGVENGLAIEDSLENLEILRKRKVRIMTLVHSQHNSWAASCTGEPVPQSPVAGKRPRGGLSPFGVQVVEAMNRLGIIPDISHGAENTFWDALEASKKPIIASHSCVYGICQSPRNLTDDQLKALGDTGGLVGICLFPSFLNDPYRKGVAESGRNIFGEIQAAEELYARDPAAGRAVRRELNEKNEDFIRQYPVTFADVADHIDRIVQYAGEDGAALGSDFDGIFSLPLGADGCNCYPALAAELESRGYSPAKIEKIFSGNFLRVLGEYDT